MKLLVALLGVVLVQQIAAEGGEGVVASMDTGVTLATASYEKFIQDTYNSKYKAPIKASELILTLYRQL